MRPKSNLGGIRAAVLLATASAWSQPAAGACDANNLYSFNFSSQPVTQLAYGSNYNYTAGNPLGATRSFNIAFAQNNLTSTQVSSQTMPRIDSTPVAPSTGVRALNIGGVLSNRTTTINSNTRTMRATFTFAVPIRDFAITLLDFDYTNDQFRDWLYISGSDGTNTYSPAMSGPYGNNNNGTATATNSSVQFGQLTGTLTVREARGNGSADNVGDDAGNINVSFAQPVTSAILYYGNYPYQSGENSTGQQAVAISTVTFCPMPAIAVTKTSAPYATSGTDRFAAPGSDVAYSLTVTNTGGSPVDAGTIVLADVLPANTTFYNGDFNASAPGMGPFEVTAGTSGVSLTAAGRAYSNNGGSTYVYNPASGYDAAVNAIRLTPSGSMAANSTFTIRFRVRVN